jgi:5,10-methylenetetrahydromethanopterin reductase
MRIGFAPAGARDAATAVELARRAEEHGLAELWLSEDYLERAAFAVAGGVAAVTERIGIGIGVINPWTRHIAVTAMECAALAELARGRLTVGLGTSNRAWMENQLGIPFRRPVSALLDFGTALRTLLAGEVLDREIGDMAVRARLSFMPPTPGPGIVYGVKGETALRRCAPAADGVMLSVLSSPAYASWVSREFKPRRLIGYALFSCDADRTAARARIAARTAQFLGVHGAAPITALGGVPAAAAAEFRRRLLAGEDAAPLVTDAMLDSLTVSGTPDDCTAAIARFAEAGVDSLILSDDGAQDPVSTLNSIAAIARRSGYVPAPLSSRRRLPTAPRLGPLEWTYVLPHERARPGARKRSCAYARR